MANGTLDPEVIKQTIFLYASLIDASVRITQNPEAYNSNNNILNNVDFSKNHKKGFAKHRFQREEFKAIYDRTSQTQINNAFLQVRKSLEKSKEGDIEYAR